MSAPCERRVKFLILRGLAQTYRGPCQRRLTGTLCESGERAKSEVSQHIGRAAGQMSFTLALTQVRNIPASSSAAYCALDVMLRQPRQLISPSFLLIALSDQLHVPCEPLHHARHLFITTSEVEEREIEIIRAEFLIARNIVDHRLWSFSARRHA
jgi:hypothetical protein